MNQSPNGSTSRPPEHLLTAWRKLADARFHHSAQLSLEESSSLLAFLALAFPEAWRLAANKTKRETTLFIGSQN